MENITIYDLLEKIFLAMLPAYKGHEKQLELYLINLPNDKLKELANKYITEV